MRRPLWARPRIIAKLRQVRARGAGALTPDMTLSAALEGFLREQVTTLPVTPDQWRNNLLGEVSRQDLLVAIQDRMTYPK